MKIVLGLSMAGGEMNNQRKSLWRFTLLTVISALFMLPLVLMLLASLKPAEQLTGDPYSLLPERVVWSNYQQALEVVPYLKYLANSIVLCLGSVLGTVVQRRVKGALVLLTVTWKLFMLLHSVSLLMLLRLVLVLVVRPILQEA